MVARHRHSGFTLLEVLLVVGLMAVLAGLVLPNVVDSFRQERLPESARQLRSLIQLTRANAMYEGRRYRIRFPTEDELDGQGDQRQPIVEVERDPLSAPEEFEPVRASWAEGETFKRNVRCVWARLGKPTIDLMLGNSSANKAYEEDVKELKDAVDVKFDDKFPPLVIDSDGTCQWITYLLTDAPPGEDMTDVDPRDTDYGLVEVIVDGLTGLAWLQRPLYQEELEMMKEHNWPPVLRMDFLRPQALTEDNVLEIRMNPLR